MSIRTRTLAAVVAVPLALAVTACGGDDGASEGRPTASELSIKYRNELGMTPAQASCTAEVLVGSDLSDASLAGMYDAQLDTTDNPFGAVELDEDDQEALSTVSEDLGACLGIAPSSSTPPASTPPDATDPADGATEAGGGAGGAATAPSDSIPGGAGDP